MAQVFKPQQPPSGGNLDVHAVADRLNHLLDALAWLTVEGHGTTTDCARAMLQAAVWQSFKPRQQPLDKSPCLTRAICWMASLPRTKA